MARKSKPDKKPDRRPAKSSATIHRDYEHFLGELKERIRTAQLRAAISVNRELVLLYWQIGRDILARQEQHGWGAKVIDQLAGDLRREFPGSVLGTDKIVRFALMAMLDRSYRLALRVRAPSRHGHKLYWSYWSFSSPGPASRRFTRGAKGQGSGIDGLPASDLGVAMGLRLGQPTAGATRVPGAVERHRLDGHQDGGQSIQVLDSPGMLSRRHRTAGPGTRTTPWPERNHANHRWAGLPHTATSASRAWVTDRA